MKLLLWWVENLKHFNATNIEHREPHMIIQIDASTKGWVLAAREFRQEETVKEREAFSHKCSRTTGIKICNPNFHKEFAAFDHSSSSRQQSCSDISLEGGWYPQWTTSKNQQVNLELSAISLDCNYCRVPSKQVQCQSRLGVQEFNRLVQLQTSAESLPENNQTLRNPNSRSICLQAVSPTSQIYGTEARSKQFCNRCNASGLEQNVWFWIPTPQLDRSGGKHGSSEKCRSNDTSNTHMADTTLVYSPTKTALTTSIAFTSPPKPITNPLREKHPLVKTRSLRLVAWKITGKPWKSKGFPAAWSNLSHGLGEQVQL